MGPNARHSIFDRLTQALQAAFPAPVRPFGLDVLAQCDEAALRDWVLRHHGQYAIDPVWVLTGHGHPPDPTPRDATAPTPVFAMSPIDPRTGDWW